VYKELLCCWGATHLGPEYTFRPLKVTKQKSKGLGNAPFLYQIERTSGDAVKGSYRREELQIVPSMKEGSSRQNTGVSQQG
jgi:hypothetical protein